MPVTYSEKTFDDIRGHKNQKEIEALAARGIINGKTDTVFDPSNTMTRAEFATIITRALGLTSNKNSIFEPVSSFSPISLAGITLVLFITSKSPFYI